MTPTERRQRILEVLCVRRHDTCDNLAHEFHVSNATIRRDIGVLMCDYPVETVCGRYGRGVRIKDTYYPYRMMGKMVESCRNFLALSAKVREVYQKT